MIFKLEAFTGINNVDDERRVTKVTFTKDGDALLSGDLKSCSNYRLYKDGLAKVRNGQTKKVTLTDGHSFWVNPTGDLSLVMDGTTLKKVATDYTTSNIKTGLTAGLEMRHAEHNQMIFMGNTESMLKYNYLAPVPSVTDWLVTTDYTGAMGWTTDSEGALLMPEEFDTPQRGYIAPPKSNILISFYARMYVAFGRFLFYSELQFPELFHPDYYIPCAEDITAVSRDMNTLYIHTLNTTKAMIGRDPDDPFQEVEYQIGAVPQRIISPPEYDVSAPIFMSRKGWAFASGGKVDYIDKENFRKDLPTGSVGYLGYDIQNREILSVVSG